MYVLEIFNLDITVLRGMVNYTTILDAFSSLSDPTQHEIQRLTGKTTKSGTTRSNISHSVNKKVVKAANNSNLENVITQVCSKGEVK